jgi:aspartyl-tRNA(Asn)/glutamyl-tRNA(Gln) amidotransferase subunit A
VADIISPIDKLAAAVVAGKVTAEALVQACLDAIKAKESFHAVLEINPEALAQARALDERIKKGDTDIKDLRLLGVPFIAKDNFLTSSTHTTAASNILKPFQAPYQSTAINKLEAEGAIMVAKANLDAFAHGSSTENSDFGPTKNPWDDTKVPGGSSGGSAAAVALGLCSFALGTDTGGSIRQPASLTGVVGLKPTYGLVSRSGVIAMGSSTDVIGPLTRTVEDAALVLDVMAGRDDLDATSIERDKQSYAMSGSEEPSVKGLKIGVIKEYLGEGLDPDVKSAVSDEIEKLKAAGAEVEEVSLPAVELALACYYILVPAEISSNLSRYDGVKYGHSATEAKTLAETYDLSRDQGLGAEAKRRIIIGTYVLSSGYYDAYYKKAQKVRTLLINQFNEAFSKFDLLLGPVAPTTAFALGSKNSDPLAMYLEDVMTVAVNLVGVPAISIPVALSKGLPIGLQLIAPQKGERQLLQAAAAVQASVPAMQVPA